MNRVSAWFTTLVFFSSWTRMKNDLATKYDSKIKYKM